VQTFLPDICEEQIAACDLEELAELTAKARVTAELWTDTFARAIAKALDAKKQPLP